MKRLVAAGVLLLFVLGVCIAGNCTVSGAYRETSGMLDECNQACIDEDWDNAVRRTQELAAAWEGRVLLLSVFVNHSDLEDLTEAVERMTAYAATQDSSGFLGECAEAELLLEKMREEQSLRIDSFL